jgi:4-amino-4-deoxy-L-arabinose transferase-like glycosyltransferase
MQPGLQEWIHKLELGAGTRYVKIGLLVLGFLTLAFRYDIAEYKAFATSEAMDTAQLARNIAQGRGYTTRFIRPLSVALLDKVRGDNQPVLKTDQPDISNPPVYPLIVAGLFKILPFEFSIGHANAYDKYQPEVFIAVFNQILFAISILVLFLLARKLFDETVAIVSAIIFAGSDVIWRFSVSGLSTGFLLLVFLAIIWCLVLIEKAASSASEPVVPVARQYSTAWFAVIGISIGVLLAIGALTRYGFGWLFFPIVAYGVLFFGKQRGLVCALIVFTFVVFLSPWCYRNYQISGHCFGTAGFAIYEQTSYFPGARLERSLPKNLAVLLNNAGLRDFAHKILVQGDAVLRTEAGKIGGNWLCASLFIAGVLIPFRNQSLTRLRIFALFALGVLALTEALGRTHLSLDYPEVNTENLLVLVLPLVIVFAVAMFFTLIEQLILPHPAVHGVLVVVFTALACFPLIFTLLPPRSSPAAYPPYSPPMIQTVSRWLKSDELMMSDMPWAVAWYGDRQCIWTTLDAGLDHAGDFFTINDYQKPIRGLYLTPLTIDTRFVSEMIRNPDGAWGRFVLESLLRTNVPTGFPLKNAPKGFLPDFLFLSDRVRWKNDMKQ